jgi:hypothetical protein
LGEQASSGNGAPSLSTLRLKNGGTFPVVHPKSTPPAQKGGHSALLTSGVAREKGDIALY